MGIITATKTLIALYQLKIESPQELIAHRINKLRYGRKQAQEIKIQKQCGRFKNKYFKNGIWEFKDVKLPDYKDIRALFYVFKDSLMVYCDFNDNYNYKLIDRLDLFLSEGAYGYQSGGFDVTVKKGDIVIDAGAWIGDFSAYAAVKGAKVYAFEPCKETISYLEQTRQLNGDIHIIGKGLSNSAGIAFLQQDLLHSGSNQIIADETASAEKIEITTIDDFVAGYQLDRVDFIKADIEGFERYMLMGATKVLKKHAPKLAICTYHHPEDPEILANIIMTANPDYKIIQKKHKLYAMVIK